MITGDWGAKKYPPYTGSSGHGTCNAAQNRALATDGAPRP